MFHNDNVQELTNEISSDNVHAVEIFEAVRVYDSRQKKLRSIFSIKGWQTPIVVDQYAPLSAPRIV